MECRFRFFPLAVVLTASLATSAAAQERPVDLVYPHLDSANSRWFFFDSASRPFGLVNLSPDTEVNGAWGSGYRYDTLEIKGLSHVHAWQLSGLSVMPVTGSTPLEVLKGDYFSAFSHETEVVRPGYHKVVLDRYGVTAEMTATTRVGLHRYTYPSGVPARIVVPLSGPMGPTEFVGGELTQIGPRSFAGHVMNGQTRRRPKETPVFFHIELDRDVTALSRSDGMVVLEFGAVDTPLLMKVGISYVSAEGAANNMQVEAAGWDFDSAVTAAADDWNSWLGRIRVSGGSEQNRRRFYSDLWHALQGRRIISDVDGRYSDMMGDERRIGTIAAGDDGKPRHAHYNYDAFWGAQWTVQTLWPLAYPEVASGFVNSMVQYYRDGGLIPRGPSGGNFTYVMSGSSATPFVVSTYQKGIRDFDTLVAWEGLVASHARGGIMARAGYEHDSQKGGGFDYYLDIGYAPFPADEDARGFHLAGAGQTLEYAYQDYALAQYTLALGKDVAPEYLKRSQNWQNLFDDETGFIRPRGKDGNWFSPFDPATSAEGFIESNALQATWFVPHDLEGLAARMGGVDVAIDRLEAQFVAAEAMGFSEDNRSTGTAEQRALSQRIPINYGNQPSMQTAYVFQALGQPWRTQKWVDRVVKTLYSKVSPYDGYNGDEDQGLMGALAALMKIGLFQMTGVEADPEYMITAPVFDRVEIDLSEHYYGGGTFVIDVRNNAEDRPYIQSATLNGQPLERLVIRHSELVAGGTLVLDMSDTPNTNLK